MDRTEIESMLQDLSARQKQQLEESRATVSKEIHEYIDSKLESEFKLIELRLDHVDVMLTRIFAELGGTNPDYIVVTAPDGTKTITTKPAADDPKG